MILIFKLIFSSAKSNGGTGGGAGGSGGQESSSGGGTSNATRQMTRTRARIMRSSGTSFRGGSGSTRVIMGSTAGGHPSSRPVVPASYVPEELISQAQVVLQGKSRNMIVRELQVYLFTSVRIV